MTLTLIAAFAFTLAAENYTGTWKIESATIAPWWKETAAPDRTFAQALTGKRITFGAKSIGGPQPLACAAARFKVVNVPVDGLFQGNLAGKPDLAAAAGFPKSATTWRTLQTGCDGAIDFHFIDAHNAAFALDNYIYKIRRQ